MRRLTGHAAIDYAAVRGLVLSKYTDPTDEARDGLTVAEAREIARVDPSLIYLETAARSVTNAMTVEAAAWAALAYDDEAPEALDARARGDHACYWPDDRIVDTAGGPIDCDAVRARYAAISRGHAEADALAARAWRETDEARRMGESPLRSHESGDDDTDGGAR